MEIKRHSSFLFLIVCEARQFPDDSTIITRKYILMREPSRQSGPRARGPHPDRSYRLFVATAILPAPYCLVSPPAKKTSLHHFLALQLPSTTWGDNPPTPNPSPDCLIRQCLPHPLEQTFFSSSVESAGLALEMYIFSFKWGLIR